MKLVLLMTEERPTRNDAIHIAKSVEEYPNRRFITAVTIDTNGKSRAEPLEDLYLTWDNDDRFSARCNL